MRSTQLSALKATINQAHPDVMITVVTADLADPTAVAQIAGHVARMGITVDLQVNNAGVGSHDKFVVEDPAAMARQIQLNVASVVELTPRSCRAWSPGTSAESSTSPSTAAFQPVPTMAVYGATKAFVLSFTEALWGETRGTGVRVLTLCPGATETAFFDNTGKSFLTNGRQRSRSVPALCTVRHRPSLSGLSNRLGATGYRLLPRSLMVRLSAIQVKEPGWPCCSPIQTTRVDDRATPPRAAIASPYPKEDNHDQVQHLVAPSTGDDSPAVRQLSLGEPRTTVHVDAVVQTHVRRYVQ